MIFMSICWKELSFANKNKPITERCKGANTSVKDIPDKGVSKFQGPCQMTLEESVSAQLHQLRGDHSRWEVGVWKPRAFLGMAGTAALSLCGTVCHWDTLSRERA